MNLAVQDQILHSPSWGAAAFGPLYLFAMRAYAHGMGLSLAVALFAVAQIYPDRLATLGWLPSAGVAAGWLATVVGGKRVAWRARRWRDFADFIGCQQAWDRWGKGLVAVAVALVGLDRLLKVAADFSIRAAMFVGAVVVAVTAWQNGRRTAPRLRWLRLVLRAVVLLAAFVAAAGVLGMLRPFDVSKDTSTVTFAIVVVLGVFVVAWPGLWRDPRAAPQAKETAARRPVAPPGVHLRTAVDAAVLMVRWPVLMLPVLVAVVIQGQIHAMQIARHVPAPDPQLLKPQELAVQLWLVILAAIPFHTFAVAIVIHMAAQVEQAQRVSVAAALRRAVVRFPASLAAYVVLLVRVVVGFMLLVVPGVVALVRGALLPQAVMLGNAGPFGAIRVSGELLRGHWWRMFLLLGVEFVVALILTAALGQVPHVGSYVAGALEGSWVAITLTLLYLRLGGTAWEAAANTATPVPRSPGPAGR